MSCVPPARVIRLCVAFDCDFSFSVLGCLEHCGFKSRKATDCDYLLAPVVFFGGALVPVVEAF